MATKTTEELVVDVQNFINLYGGALPLAAKTKVQAWLDAFHAMREEKLTYTENTQIVCVGFDGVLHRYSNGWNGVGVIDDVPIDGAINFLQELLFTGLDVRIQSARSNSAAGIAAMKAWLLANGLSQQQLDAITFEPGKVRAHVTIDSRCLRFDGQFPRMSDVLGFQPYRNNFEGKMGVEPN